MIFEDITLNWKGTEATIPANSVLRLIAKVESVLTLAELHQASSVGNLPLGKLSQAFGIMLRFAGVKVMDEDIYESMITGGAQSITDSVNILLMLMIPPNLTESEQEAGEDLGKSTPDNP